MLHPTAWLDLQRMRLLLRSYPGYAPPRPGLPHYDLNVEDGKENYRYFLATKIERILGLSNFLANFSVPLTTDQAGLRAVDAWLHRYGGHLVTRDRHVTGVSYGAFIPPWTGNLVGLNVIWDLGIYAGNAAIHANHNCSWVFNDGSWTKEGKHLTDYLKPCLSVEWRRQPYDIFETVLQIAQAKQCLLDLGGRSQGAPDSRADALQQRVRFVARQAF